MTLRLSTQSAEQNKLLKCPNQNEEGIGGRQTLDMHLMYHEIHHNNTASFITAQVSESVHQKSKTQHVVSITP